MKTGILTPKILFGNNVRYVIPTFQRPYVWTQEDQWEPLWSDVRDTAEDYLERVGAVGIDRRAEAEQATTAHFLGAVVLQQQLVASDAVDHRDVIDGQQRLTTLQLLLDAAQQVLDETGQVPQAKRLSKYVLNDPDFVGANEDHHFKVWPTNVDREAFRHAMRNDLPEAQFEDSAIVQAHMFFRTQVAEWLHQDEAQLAARAAALETVLTSLLQVVVIDLDHNDDAHIIFETLNARGTPLLQSDLVKNFVLYQVEQLHQDREKFYRDTWQQFDTTWWRDDIRQGRLVRPRVDVFLNYWLAMRLNTDVPATKVFDHFQEHAKGKPIETVALDFKIGGDTFRRIEQRQVSGEETFLYRWEVMDAGVFTPLLLRLYAASESDLPFTSRRRALRALESYLVRRMLCRTTAKNYNVLTVELVKALDGDGLRNADQMIIEHLRKQTADSREWPTDAQVRQAILTLPLYRLLTRGRLRFVLEAIEDQLRGPKSEAPVEHNLSIEHLMPQAWRGDHWPPPAGEGDLTDLAASRDRTVHTIGNLTLVKGQLNSAMSNGPWAQKLQSLNKHSVLLMNKEIEGNAIWDESLITTRGVRLAERITEAWPGPDGF